MPADNKSTGLLTVLATAFVAACALEYLIHSEWGFYRIAIRDDALGAAGVLIILVGLRNVFAGNRKKGS